MSGRVLSIEEAVPLLLDRAVSPVIGLDTEFNSEEGILHGMSMAGGTPETGFFGCFWSFEERWQQKPWADVFKRVIAPIFGDPLRTVVMHPISIDIKWLRRRGLTDAMTRCSLEDTIAMAHIYDDNLPHSLKDLMYCILLDTTATSYAVTQREIASIRATGKKVTDETLALVWEHYKDHRQKSTEIEVELDPSWPEWWRLAMDLPPGMNRVVHPTWKCGGKSGCGHTNITDAVELSLSHRVCVNTCANCGRERKIKLGVEHHVRPLIEPANQADYDRQAHERFALYGAKDAIATLAIRYRLKPTFDAMQLQHLDMETRITHPVVTRMEEHGMMMDIPLLSDICVAMRAATDRLHAEVLRMWGDSNSETPFVPASPDQVAKRLWVDWGVRPPRWAIDPEGGIKGKHRRKDGMCKADKLVLEDIAKTHAGKPVGDAVTKLIDLRRWTKLLGTYVEPMLRMSQRDPQSRIHASFWPTGARSGRFAHSDPNVGNIPRPNTMPTMRPLKGKDPTQPPPGMLAVHNKELNRVNTWRVRSLRDVFIAPPGYLFVSADLSQIENRLIAYEAQEPSMLRLYRKWDCFECKASGEHNIILHACPQCGAAEGKRNKSHPDQPVVKGFVHGGDIHSLTSAMLGFFDKYGDDGRQQAKPVNHAATYGMGPGTFSKRENVPYKDAKASLDQWHRSYPAVSHLHTRVKEDAKEKGFIRLFDGHMRRFHVQRLLERSGNLGHWEWEAVIREGVNVLAQGGTGVIMKRAMLTVDAIIDRRGWRGKINLCNQVHDELLYEVPEELADEFNPVLIHSMEHAAPELPIPILAEGGRGRTWGAAH